MRHKQIWLGLMVTILIGCSDSNNLSDEDKNKDSVTKSPSKQESEGQSPSLENPIIGTWRLIPGQSGGEYWPTPCREITFRQRASYCGDTGAPNSYEVQKNQVTVYDKNFEQIYRFPDSNTMTTNVAGVGTLRFKRTN